MSTPSETNVSDISVEHEMKKSYLDYAMSVIVSRALPDCRDGLKPVHRRILYAMHDTGNRHDKPYRKSARTVGEVMSKYHPHGDAAIYGSLVRMAQNFSLREMLVDGQGNFGSVDGDSPAQMRYTEVRLRALTDEGVLFDIDKDTVEFRDNYDNSTQEPVVLPVKFPNLLVNGASGIAVGMATNIPTFNLGEVIDGCCAYLDNEHISSTEMLNYVLAPDFPTGGEVFDYNRIKSALERGQGTIYIRGQAEVTELNHKNAIIITELPYQVNKAELVKNIEVLSRNKILEGISEIRDESSQLGMRVVIEIKKEYEPEVLLSRLYKDTELQISFGVNIVALKDGQPQIMNVLEIIRAFVKFREEVVIRRTIFLCNKARDRAHILIGLLIAVCNIDEVVSLIKSSRDTATAKARLMEKKWDASVASPLIKIIYNTLDTVDIVDTDNTYQLTLEQANAILEMRLSRLTALEHSKIIEELKSLAIEIREYEEILNLRSRLLEVIRKELLDIKEKFATPRKTKILSQGIEFTNEDLIQREDMAVLVTRNGYIKRTILDEYRVQKRGGKGKVGMHIYEEDAITDAIIGSTHDDLLFFSNIGKVYKTKIYKLPLASPQARGRALVNILPLSEKEKITAILPLRKQVDDNDASVQLQHYIIFATAMGNARRNLLSDFHNIPSNGKIAIKLEPEDSLVGVVTCTDENHILFATANGKAVRFSITALRVFRGRASDGVRAVKLIASDAVVSIAVLHNLEIAQETREAFLQIPVSIRRKLSKGEFSEESNRLIADICNATSISRDEIIDLCSKEQFILTVTSYGYGKCTSSYEYRATGRGVQGITNIKLPSPTARVISSLFVDYDTDEVILLTGNGSIIRVSVKNVRVTGRSAIGVRIIHLQKKNIVTSVEKIYENKNI